MLKKLLIPASLFTLTLLLPVDAASRLPLFTIDNATVEKGSSHSSHSRTGRRGPRGYKGPQGEKGRQGRSGTKGRPRTKRR